MGKSNGKILTVFITTLMVLTAQWAQAQFCNFSSQDIECNGEQTGIISFNSTGGVAPYNYTWSHDPANSTNEAVNLTAGSYSVTIEDATGLAESCTIVLDEPSPITITNVFEVDPMCGMMDGSLEIEAIPQSGGALSDLMFSIDGGSSFQTSNLFENLGAGDYLIIIADINGCFIVDSRQLVDATAVAINLNSGMCEPGGTIAIDIDVSGGTLPYTYLWSNGAITEDISGVPQGMYSVTVTDREGCSSEIAYTVDNCCDNSMFCGGTVQSASCNNASDGSITVSPTGGSGNYMYVWDTGETTPTISGLSAGFYNVTITDDAACEATCGFEVINPTPIDITMINTTDPTCGGNDGVIEIIASPQSNGNLADLMYSIDGANFQAGNTFTGLAAGNYTIVVNDNNGCFASTARDLNDVGGVTINIVDSFCESSSTVGMTVMATGGTGPYTFTWTSNTGFSASGISISGAPQGIYTATATDVNGCMASIMITQDNCCDPSMFCTSTTTNPACSGDASGSISITPNGGVGPFSYQWSHDATLTTADANGLLAGFYNVTVTDSGGCNAICGVDLVNPASIIIDDVMSTDPMCGLANGSLVVSATPKTGSGCNMLEYSIDGGMNFQASNSFNDLISGDYLVVVRDCDACSAFQSNELLNIGGISFSFVSTCVNGSLDIDVTPMGGTPPYTFSWIGPNGFSSFNEDIIGGENGDYDLTVIDADGCEEQMIIPEDISCFGGSIDGVVFTDTNGNGMFDAGESVEVNIPVSLFNANGVLVSTIFTDSNGSYSFEGQDPGQYIVQFNLPSEYSFTFPNIGSDGADSDVTGANGLGTTPLLNFTGSDLTIDAGVYVCVPVGELVWFDINENDQKDPTENGINGIQVKVWRKGLAPGYFEFDYTHTGPKPGTPSDDGYYKFCLPPGEYYLEYLIPPFGLVPVVPGIGGSINDSDVTGANGPGTTNTFFVMSGQERCDLSAGYYPMATLGNNIFLDGNGNGLADFGEFGMSDVTIELYDAESNEMLESQVTDADGSYLFDYLQRDEYYLKVIPPTDYIVTIPNVGNNEDMDSDVDNSNGLNTTPTFSLDPGMELENVDIGLVQGITVAVDWVSISGENKGNYNQINWTVGFQNSTSHYEVERRTPDEFEFTVLDKVEANNLLSLIDYEYQDWDIDGKTIAYYRVAEIDINGNRSYSDVISIDFRAAARETKITVGPNPFIADLIIQIDTPLSGEAVISFWDISGKLVKIPSLNSSQLSPGINTLDFDWSGIPAGVYTAQVLINNNQFIQKIIKIE